MEPTTTLFVDTRERDVAAIAELMDTVAAEKEDANARAARAGYRYATRQITTGDFAIVRASDDGERILASVERKSLEDYAASLRDGRYDNINKQLALRERYGTDVYLLVEGPLCPSPGRRFSKFPFRVIESSFTDLMVQHRVQVLFTPDHGRSAARMLDLQRAYHKLADVARFQTVATGELGARGAEGGAIGVLTATHVRSPAQDQVTMWAALPRVSQVLGRALAQHSVEELLTGDQRERTRRVLNLRTVLGKQFPLPARRTLNELATCRETQLRLLAGIPTISRTVAVHLLDEARGRGTIQQLLAQNPPDAVGESTNGKKKAGCALAAIEVPFGRGLRPLGQLKAERILTALRRKVNTPTPSSASASASTSTEPPAGTSSAGGPGGTA